MRRKNLKKIIEGGIVGVIGFILSPLSWWNDLLVNVPLAYAGAYVFGWLLHIIAPFPITPVQFTALIIIFYWITNAVGIWMMMKGYTHAAQKKKKVLSLWNQLFVATMYSIIIIIIALLFVDASIVQQKLVFPDWVI